MKAPEEESYKPMNYGFDYKSSHQKTIDELDEEGFIYNASFYEEANTYIIKKESDLQVNFSKIKNGEKYFDKYDEFKKNELNNDKDYIKIITHHMGAVQKAQKIKKFFQENDKQKEKMKRYKQIKGLKYNTFKFRINIIQLSVIFLSIILTFLESLQNLLNIKDITFSIIPIIISGYISFVTAMSRFLKYEDTKETLIKLDEKQSFIISRLTLREIRLRKMLPITRFTIQDKINEIIELDFDKDGLDEMITQTYQEYDINMSYTDKLYYKKIWLEMKEKDVYQKGNSKNLQKLEKQIKKMYDNDSDSDIDNDSDNDSDNDNDNETENQNNLNP